MDDEKCMAQGSPDADWSGRETGSQQGLLPSPSPSPQTPWQVMHKAENKYEVGKIADKEEAIQRRVRSILNKLTPQNFRRLFAQIRGVNIDNALTLTGAVSQIFNKALMEPTFCEVYATFCRHLADVLPRFSGEGITFKRLLLNKCQEEFERREREEAEGHKVEMQQSEAEKEERRLLARMRGLGNVRLLGELYKQRMLTERIMHECIKKLLGQHRDPDEEDAESLCVLMSTIGETIDHPKAKEHMDAYFDTMTALSTNQKLSSRVRFKLRDAIDLRKNKWQNTRIKEPSGVPWARRRMVGTMGGGKCTAWRRHAPGVPRTRWQVKHKAETKYEVGGMIDDEEAKQRRLRAILEKLTPQNFEELFVQVEEITIDNAVTLTGVVSQIFDRATMEPALCEMYAGLCSRLAGVLPDFNEMDERITFKRLLMNKCQEEFERREREEAEGHKVEMQHSEAEKEERRLLARMRGLGNVRLLGELYKQRMLTERIMHECIKKFLGQHQNPAEEDVEALCGLLGVIGKTIDHPKAKEHMDAYFDTMAKLSTDQKLSSRTRFMLRDVIDLRKNKWEARRKEEEPKKIDVGSTGSGVPTMEADAVPDSALPDMAQQESKAQDI
ncbi:unnamed protein product [Musa acuminata subsp. malaccensis]|uniref:(wild Malaysian banana) hypothetical protein n=1 Tax=Musa acuminata subsp. malaccensis TaxID=214687 RepID=A0A804LAB3_MUSAM|nr:PREDICTED: eukaryotic translation initiation factor-like [Musa acuminata subsp. malaccensis]CAG1865261.1 unnamed protein product [Musa acuminata subsp. malaccensis]